MIPQRSNMTWNLLLLTWLVALVSTLSALFIGEVMGQAPCVLCWFQRAFMFPLAVILAIASYRVIKRANRPPSAITSRAQLWPGAPVTPPPGWVPAPHIYSPFTGPR